MRWSCCRWARASSRASSCSTSSAATSLAGGSSRAACSCSAASLVILGLAQNLPGLQDGDDVAPLLLVVVVVAFVAGVCYAFVAVPAQTSLQEELEPEVRGRVFGVLNMLVSLASFVPIIIVGPLADVVSAAAVIVISAIIVGVGGGHVHRVRAPARDGLGAARPTSSRSTR